MRIQAATRPIIFIEPTDLLERARAGVKRLEVRFRRKDGSYLWAQVTGEEIRYEEASATLCWVYDISEHKRTELELTGERDKAEQIARTRTDFLAMVSHEIRTPLNGILGTLRMLGDTLLDAGQREFVGHDPVFGRGAVDDPERGAGSVEIRGRQTDA